MQRGVDAAQQLEVEVRAAAVVRELEGVELRGGPRRRGSCSTDAADDLGEAVGAEQRAVAFELGQHDDAAAVGLGGVGLEPRRRPAPRRSGRRAARAPVAAAAGSTAGSTAGSRPCSRTSGSQTGRSFASCAGRGESTVSSQPTGERARPAAALRRPRPPPARRTRGSSGGGPRRSASSAARPRSAPSARVVLGRWRKPLNQTSPNVTPSVVSSSSGSTPPMWSLSMWLTISSSKWRSSARQARRCAARSAVQVPGVPASISARRGFAASPYSSQSASPWPRGQHVDREHGSSFSGSAASTDPSGYATTTCEQSARVARSRIALDACVARPDSGRRRVASSDRPSENIGVPRCSASSSQRSGATRPARAAAPPRSRRRRAARTSAPDRRRSHRPARAAAARRRRAPPRPGRRASRARWRPRAPPGAGGRSRRSGRPRP